MLARISCIAMAALMAAAQSPEEAARTAALRAEIEAMQAGVKDKRAAMELDRHNVDKFRRHLEVEKFKVEKEFHLEKELLKDFEKDFEKDFRKDLLGKAEMARLNAELYMLAQQPPIAVPPRPPGVGGPLAPGQPAPARAHYDMSDDQAYRRGLNAIAERQYERAVEYLNSAAQRKGDKSDGALYWKAYALNKLGKRDEALAALDEMRKAAPSSRYLNDAKALELQVRQSSGQPVSPESESDEDLKLYALSSLSRTEPERVIPVVARILDSASSLRLKERALYVLAQTRSAQALPTVAKLAKGGGTPDLQRKAVEYLGVFESPEVGQTLSEIYTSTSDQDIKRAVLHSYMRGKDKTRLLAAARGESNEELKREAVQALAASGATDEVWSLYQDSSGEARVNVLRAIGTRAGAEKLTEIARSDKDPRLRSLAVQYLGRMRTSQTLEALLGFYGSESDVVVRKAIISGVYNHGEAKPLVELARKESNPELKKAIVERLSHMRSKEASDYMLELLNK